MFKKYVDFSGFILKLDPFDPSHMLSKFFRVPSSTFHMTLTVHTRHLNVIQITGLQFSCESFQQNSHNTFTHNGDAQQSECMQSLQQLPKSKDLNLQEGHMIYLQQTERSKHTALS